MANLRRIADSRYTSSSYVYAKYAVGIGLSALGLALGFLCLGRALETALDPNPNRLNKRETVTAGFLIGMPTTAGALWLLRSLKRDRTITHSQRLQLLLYKALKANSGKISALQFAMLAQIPLTDAKHFLDDWAVSLEAEFQVDEAGSVMYCFNLPKLSEY